MGIHVSKQQVVAVGTPLLLGQVVGAVQGRDSFTWFQLLKKPAWCPPPPVFPVVWTVLYALMGYASYIVYQYGGWEAQKGLLILYGVQLALNLAWPILFFKVQKLKLAQFENLALLGVAATTAKKFYDVDSKAGLLLVPYIAWLILANALNLYIAKNNFSADEDPRLQDLYHQDDKRNPGEQGFKPASAIGHGGIVLSQNAPGSKSGLRMFGHDLRSSPLRRLPARPTTQAAVVQRSSARAGKQVSSRGTATMTSLAI